MEVEKLTEMELAILVFALETLQETNGGNWSKEFLNKLDSLSGILNEEYKIRNLSWRMFE